MNVFDLIKEKKDRINRIIIWEKWYDPLGTDLEDREFPGAIGTFRDDKKIEDFRRKRKILAGQIHADKWEDNELEPFTVSGEYNAKREGMQHLKVIMTSLGAIAITDHNRAGKVFNFWIGHTNFRLTPETVEIIENVDGVEGLDLYTPYRFRIAIGKAFVGSEVMSNLNHALRAESS